MLVWSGGGERSSATSTRASCASCDELAAHEATLEQMATLLAALAADACASATRT